MQVLKQDVDKKTLRLFPPSCVSTYHCYITVHVTNLPGLPQFLHTVSGQNMDSGNVDSGKGLTRLYFQTDNVPKLRKHRCTPWKWIADFIPLHVAE